MELQVFIFIKQYCTDDITGVNENEITEINVYVKQDDAAQSLMDAASYSFGILADLDRENTDTALQQMASETGGEVSTKEYSSLTELADGLLKGDCQAIVLNRAYLVFLMKLTIMQAFLLRSVKLHLNR